MPRPRSAAGRPPEGACRVHPHHRRAAGGSPRRGTPGVGRPGTAAGRGGDRAPCRPRRRRPVRPPDLLRATVRAPDGTVVSGVRLRHRRPPGPGPAGREGPLGRPVVARVRPPRRGAGSQLHLRRGGLRESGRRLDRAADRPGPDAVRRVLPRRSGGGDPGPDPQDGGSGAATVTPPWPRPATVTPAASAV